MDNRQTQQSEKCALCLSKNSRKGTDGCSHTFCFSCLKKWSKRQNTCPVCGENFSKISKIEQLKKNETNDKKKDSKKKKGECSNKQQKDNDQQQVELKEENIFAILMGPETRSNQGKLEQLYQKLMEINDQY